MDFGSHPSTNLNVLLDRFIVIQGCAKVMSSKWDMTEDVWRRLWRFAIQQNCGAGRLSMDGQRGNFLNRFQWQMDVGSHPSTNLDVLLDRFIVIQGCAKLMG